MVIYLVMFVVALVAVVMAYRIGFGMAMKIKDIKIEQSKEQETKIQRFIEILADFIDEKVVKTRKPNTEDVERVNIDGTEHDARTFWA